MSKHNKLSMLMIATLTSVVQIIHANNGKKIAGLKTVYEKYVNSGLAIEIAASQKFDTVLSEIQAQESVVEIIEQLPDWKKGRYVQQYKLQGLLKPLQNRQTGEDFGGQSPAIQVRKALPVFDKKAEEVLDISWMNHDFFFRSGVVTGDEGSGKTVILAYIAANIMSICPDVDIKIHNIHYDPDEPWFPGMPSEVEASLFITDTRECYNDILNVYSELRRREISKDKKSHPIVRICDEFQGLADVLGQDDWKEYVNAITQIKNRGRKYARKEEGEDTGIRIWCGTHSLKQKMTGLDSSFFAGSNVICLGDSIKDPNTPFPADFDIKKLTSELGMCKAALIQMGMITPGKTKSDKARPAVVRLAGGNPTIKVIPKPDLSSIVYEVLDYDSEEEVPEGDTGSATAYAGRDYMEKLKSWYRAQTEEVSDNQLKQELFKLSGKMVNDELLQKLRELLNES